jgi:uncharacterized protein YkwD
MRKTAIAVIVASWTLLLAPASPAAAACPGASLGLGQQSTEQAQSAITCLIKKQRKRHHVRAIRSHPQLTYAAVTHSSQMASGNFFGHAGPDGTPQSRAAATGYMAGAHAWGVGENIGWGIGRNGSPRVIVRAWMRSAAHRAVMLDGRFRQVGVGVVEGAPMSGYDRGAATVTALFGYRKG